MSSIAIIGPAHPLRGGIAAFNERLAIEFKKAGHTVTIFSFSLQYPSFLFPGKTQYTDSPPPEELDIRTEINSMNPVSWLRTGKSIRKMQPDIVIVRFWIPFLAPCLGSVLRQIKRNKHSRIICIADNITPHEKRAGDKELTNYFVKPCDAFVAMSKVVENDLRLFTSKPVRLILHPLYDQFGEKTDPATARKQLQINFQGKLLLFFGLVRRYKGLDLLLQTMTNARIQQEGIKLIVAGEFYEDENMYRSFIEKNNLGTSVMLFNHFIPDADVKYFFSAVDAVILPYRNATQSGIAPIAYQMEKPMIVTNVGGLPDSVEDGKTGLVCVPEPVSIANSILKFYEIGTNHFAPFIEEARKHYSWKTFIHKILELGISPEKEI